VVAGLAVVVALTAGIVGADPYKRFQSFKEPPQSFAGGNYTASHLASGAGNGRWQFWQAAFDQFKSKPLSGGGAGSYEAYWAKHGTINYFVRDAHSLYLQTLGELGIGGFLLLVGFFGSVFLAARRRLALARGPDRAVSLALDWMWQLTVVGAIGVAAFALLTGPSTDFGPEGARRRLTPRGRFLARAVAVGLAFTAIAGLAIPLLAQTDVRASQQSAAKGNHAAALSHALDGRKWQPWAASTQLQVALAQRDAGQLPAAKASIAKAIQRDPSDWRLFVVSAQIENALGHPRAARADLQHAKSMSPHSAALASVQ